MPILRKKKAGNSASKKIADRSRLKALARKEEKKQKTTSTTSTTTSTANHANHWSSDISDSSDSSDSSDYEEYLVDIKPQPTVSQSSEKVDIKNEKQPEPEKKIEKPVKTEKKKLKSRRKKKIIINNYYYKKEDKAADTKEKVVDKPEVIKKEVASAPIPRDTRADLVKKVREQYILSRARQNILNF